MNPPAPSLTSLQHVPSRFRRAVWPQGQAPQAHTGPAAVPVGQRRFVHSHRRNGVPLAGQGGVAVAGTLFRPLSRRHFGVSHLPYARACGCRCRHTLMTRRKCCKRRRFVYVALSVVFVSCVYRIDVPSNTGLVAVHPRQDRRSGHQRRCAFRHCSAAWHLAFAHFDPFLRLGLNVDYWNEADNRLAYALRKYPWVTFSVIPYGEAHDTMKLAGIQRSHPACHATNPPPLHLR